MDKKVQATKKGQLGLVDLMSYVMYFISVLIIVLVLNLPGCGTYKATASAGIQGNTDLVASVRGDAQLDSYLRTQLPGKEQLFARLKWLSDNKAKPDTGWDISSATGFLNSHPEVYDGRDYSSFISSLQVFYYSGDKTDMDKARNVFNVVTAALFLREVKNDKGESIFYLFPLGVDFDNSDRGQLSGLAEKDPLLRTESLCQLKQYELCAEFLPYPFSVLQDIQAVQVIPLASSELAKVELRYIPELSTWLPRP